MANSMGCCGQRRSQASIGGALAGGRQRPPQPASRAVLYEYTGTSGMTVTGPVSGLVYRFGLPGAQLQIDVRDAASLVGLPNLRRRS